MATPNPMNSLVSTLEPYFTSKSPYQLPKNIREFLVKYIPWINVVILVILAPGILLALGIGTAALPFSGISGIDSATGLSITLLALIIQVVLMIAALPGLFNRKINGWNLSFYAVIFNFAYSLLNFQIVSGLIGALIGAYILFQIKSYYK